MDAASTSDFSQLHHEILQFVADATASDAEKQLVRPLSSRG